VAGGVVAGILIIIIIIIVIVVVSRRKQRDNDPSAAVPIVGGGAEINPVQLNMKEIIGQTFWGTVYRGELKVCVRFVWSAMLCDSAQEGTSKISVAVRTPPQGASKAVKSQFLKELALVQGVGLHANILEYANEPWALRYSHTAASLASAPSLSRS
jgi:hypothetical protein